MISYNTQLGHVSSAFGISLREHSSCSHLLQLHWIQSSSEWYSSKQTQQVFSSISSSSSDSICLVHFHVLSVTVGVLVEFCLALVGALDLFSWFCLSFACFCLIVFCFFSSFSLLPIFAVFFIFCLFLFLLVLLGIHDWLLSWHQFVYFLAFVAMLALSNIY